MYMLFYMTFSYMYPSYIYAYLFYAYIYIYIHKVFLDMRLSFSKLIEIKHVIIPTIRDLFDYRETDIIN